MTFKGQDVEEMRKNKARWKRDGWMKMDMNE